MTFLTNRRAIALFGLLATILLTPTTASAKGSVHIDIPGFSIGYHDKHNRGHRNRGYDRNYRHYDRHSYRRYDRYKRRYDNRRSYRQGYRHGSNNYYYSGRSNRNYDYYSRDRGYRDSYNRGYNDRSYCPSDTYSQYANRDRSCYQHKDHFHCD